jgi:hypothetical protein
MNAFEAANHYISKASRIMDLGPRVERLLLSLKRKGQRRTSLFSNDRPILNAATWHRDISPASPEATSLDELPDN